MVSKGWRLTVQEEWLLRPSGPAGREQLQIHTLDRILPPQP